MLLTDYWDEEESLEAGKVFFGIELLWKRLCCYGLNGSFGEDLLERSRRHLLSEILTKC